MAGVRAACGEVMLAKWQIKSAIYLFQSDMDNHIELLKQTKYIVNIRGGSLSTVANCGNMYK